MNVSSFTAGDIWQRTRTLRYVFAIGMFFGIAIGWFFHGLISLIFRFGVVAILMIPIAVLVFMWWRSSRERDRMQTTMVTMSWKDDQTPPISQRPHPPSVDAVEVRDFSTGQERGS